jgi:hypothetical protein
MKTYLGHCHRRRGTSLAGAAPSELAGGISDDGRAGGDAAGRNLRTPLQYLAYSGIRPIHGFRPGWSLEMKVPCGKSRWIYDDYV